MFQLTYCKDKHNIFVLQAHQLYWLPLCGQTSNLIDTPYTKLVDSDFSFQAKW